ncbi:MAG: set domain protein [Monoraphidium minutum]|nr:MAG: set domain protein [Monoraphidium minutum]
MKAAGAAGAATAARAAAGDACDPKFLRWCRAHGLEAPGVAPAFVADGWRGVVAAAPLAPGDVLVLAVHLLHEASKGPASFWALYIRQLPRGYSTLACFHPAAAAALQLPHAAAAAAVAVEKEQAAWRGAFPLLQDLGVAKKWSCWGAWQWAASTVLSRTISSGDEGAGKGGSGTREEEPQGCGDGAFDTEANAYKLYARRRYEPGEQVFLCYGCHTNLELLETYGFTLPPGAGAGDNPHDTAPLPPELLRAAWRGAPPPPEGDCWLHWDGRPGWRLLRALREAAAAPGELRARGRRALEGRAISAEGDARAAAWLRVACAAQLAALPTAAAHDAAELAALEAEGAAGGGAAGGSAAGGAAECMRLAVAWRLGYKRILERGSRLGLPGV